MVPGSAGDGDRPGDHGLRRRRAHRRAAGRRVDGPLQVRLLGRREGGVPGDGGRLLRLHDVRRVHLPRPRAGLAAGGVRPRREAEEAGHVGGRLGGPRLDDAAVLAALGGALPERDGRDRRARPGVADVSGHVRRPRGGRRRLRGPAQPVQHGRPVLLVLGLRHHGTQGDLQRLLPPRGRPLRARARWPRRTTACPCSS